MVGISCGSTDRLQATLAVTDCVEIERDSLTHRKPLSPLTG
jgi:hypothetical protein